RVFDVATSATADSVRVDPATCEADRRGASELCTVWQDPEWDPSLRAFYYVRLLENPTCRWSTRVCREHGVDPLSSACAAEAARAGESWRDCCLDTSGDGFAEATVRERAWSSPVWVRPDGISSVEGSIDAARGEAGLAIAIGALPGALAPPVAPLRLRASDARDLLSLDVPPGAWVEEAIGPGGRRWRAATDAAEFSIESAADGSAVLRVDGRGLPVPGTDGVDHAVRLSLESGVYRAAHERRWRVDGARLSPRGS
ncbi:DUF3604 domain-containing protein, partial [bacterium]|nr:DUF3604 domain-containing protein [bacterium]